MLKIKDICDELNVSTATIYRLIKRGEFPKPVKIGGASRWPTDTVANFLKAQDENNEL